ncbi:hypothetical protein ACNF42_06100 [Cuniculiplasma sp. SKW3]|uniref:hypothetical protein n=1 Tax=Cuniculiplasma sp. SKW3 TaxID=3400170 RepID=UPI003FD20BC5
MNHIKVITLVSIFVLLFSVPMVVTSQSHASNGSFGATTTFNVGHGPTSVVPKVLESQRFQIFVNATRGYSNYSATLIVGADYDIGLSPTVPDYKTSKNGFFEFNVTAPNTDNQSISVMIIVRATFGSTPVEKTLTYSIEVYKAVTFYAVITDGSGAPYYNITVYFQIGSLNKTTVVSKILPGQSELVSVKIPDYLLGSGEHSVVVGIVNASIFHDVNVNYKSSFYVGNPPNYDWIYYFVALAAVIMVILFLASGKRKLTPGLPKWKNRRQKKKQ